MNGGYYVDYASIMGMMGLTVMHHTSGIVLFLGLLPTWSSLAKWSCEQFRADIEKRNDKDKWTASFNGFYLTKGTTPIIHRLLCMM